MTAEPPTQSEGGDRPRPGFPIVLTVCLLRLLAGQFTPQKHFGFEAAAWYWHFVDVVWLFLFAFVYVAFGGGSHG